MVKELSISKYRALIRIFVLVGGLLFFSPDVFALLHSGSSDHISIQATSTESHSYTYYPSYDRKMETVVKDGATLKNRTFTYDETNWIKIITEAAGAGGAITCGYDANGNSTAKTDTTGEGPASTIFTYNSRNQLIGVAAGNAGSEVGKGTYHYNYQRMRIRHLGSARGDIEYVYDDKSIIDELSNTTTMQVVD